jgi:glycosyltransferase involved in cell wall biosynthesis
MSVPRPGIRPLIVIGPTPPPIHGVAFTTPHVLAAISSLGRLAAHLETRDPRPVTTTGRLDVRNLWLGLLHSWRLAGLLRRQPDADVYLPLSQGTWGFLRDAAFIWLARAARRRVYVHLNGGLFRRFYDDAPRPMQAFMRATLREVHEAWVLTPAHAAIFDGLIPRDRVRLLENAADDPTAEWEDGRRGSDGRRILYLSNLVPAKGCFDLLAALERLGDAGRGAHVRFVGEADEDVADEVRRRGQELARNGVEIELAGVHVDEAKAADFQWADIFVLPSKYPPEGQPLVLLEAMAAALPIVSTRHSGIPHTVRDGQEGLLVEPADVAALADALGRLMSDRDLRERLGRAGRVRYERVYTPSAFQQRVADLFD